MPSQQQTSDIEAGSNRIRPLDGFPTLAQFIAGDHDRTTLVFKRFSKLAARNLLYLQGELAHLQAQQDAFDSEDKSLEDDADVVACAKNWELFEANAQADHGEPGRLRKRMELVMKIRDKLHEYSASAYEQ